MDNVRKWAGVVGIVLFFGAGLFLFIKGSFNSVWHSPAEVTTYSVDGVDGRSMTLILLPGNLAYFTYTEPDPIFLEAALVRFRGTYANNYFGNVWNIDRNSPQSPLGIRIYGEGVLPVIMEADVLGKFINGTGNPTFPNEGDQMNPVLLFSHSSVEFQGMPLTKVPNSDNLTSNLMQRIPLPN